MRLDPDASAELPRDTPGHRREEGGALYSVGRDAVEYRVHDGRTRNGFHRLAPGDAQADARYFVAADGRARAYDFGARPEHERATDVETLNRQFYRSVPSARGPSPRRAVRHA
jgi:hypothetical protein